MEHTKYGGTSLKNENLRKDAGRAELIACGAAGRRIV